MKRLLPLIVGVLLVAAPAFAQTTAKAKKEGKSGSESKSASASGKVTAVTAASLAVKGKKGELTFSVDKDTTVVAKGASHKMAAMKADNKPTLITEFVNVGDDVSVKYHDMGATKHAATVTVRSASSEPPAKKKK
jgi:hypothetical protein